MATKQDVEDFLRIHNKRPEIWMDTPLSCFGGISAKEYGKLHGWEYVLACARRIFA